MNLHTKYMTGNDCYKAGKTITPKGIMVHSTATPGKMAAWWFDAWNKSYAAGEISRQSCVHAFLDDTEIWQYLPWEHRGWHAGGEANDTHIGFEICEPEGFTYVNNVMTGYDPKAQAEYFQKIWANAVELCVFLCEKYGLTEKDILCHSEGYAKGIASNHGDVMHWFPKHGQTMDTFRAAVKAALGSKKEEQKMKYYELYKEDMNLRSGPGANYTDIGDIPKGTVIEVSELSGTWGKTIYGGKTGWCSTASAYAREVAALAEAATEETVSKALYDTVVKERDIYKARAEAAEGKLESIKKLL